MITVHDSGMADCLHWITVGYGAPLNRPDEATTEQKVWAPWNNGQETCRFQVLEALEISHSDLVRDRLEFRLHQQINSYKRKPTEKKARPREVVEDSDRVVEERYRATESLMITA